MLCAHLCVYVLIFTLVLLSVIACVRILELTYVVVRVPVVPVLVCEPVHALALRSKPALVLVSVLTLVFVPLLPLVSVSVLRPALVRSCTCKCTCEI